MAQLEGEVPLPSNQAEFETALMNILAERHSSLGMIIWQQFRVAGVVDRYGSRVGCFTHFAVPEECEPLPVGTQSPLDGPLIRIRGITGSCDYHDEPNYGTAGSILFHEKGRISMLECHGYGDSWPEDYYEFEFLPAEESLNARD